MAQALKRGILQSFNPTSYTGSVLLLEAGSFALQNVPVATHIDGTSAQVGSLCAVLFFDEQNQSDAVVIACYPNGTQGVPTPSPGRLTFVTPYQQLSAVVIGAGVTATYGITGGASGIPAGALGILFKAYFSAAAVPAHIDIAPHGGNLSATWSLGDVQAVGNILNGGGLVPVDASGQIDIRANGGACTVNLWTYGYIV